TVYFDIVPATNSWTVAPQMSPWTYDGYNKDINFITDGLAFGGATVYYRLGKRVNGAYEWVDVGGNLSVKGNPAPEYFEVDENGKVSDAVAEKLNALGAGTYYLCGYINPSNNVNGTYNVNGYLMSEQAYSTVVVMQSANSWEITPYVLDWAYNGFSSTNFQAGETVFGKNDEDNEITYTLYEGTPTTGTLRKTFKTLNDVVDGEKISDTLNNLDVNTYTLVASKGGSDDYRSLSLQMTFVVYKATNAWTITPFINSWTYKKFTPDNVRAGKALFGVKDEDGNITITYTLYEGDKAEGTPLRTFNTLNDSIGDGKTIADVFVNLPAKTYTILASVGDTDNYDGLNMTITFAVTKASNTWTTMPVMTSWAYNMFTAGNFQAGITELGVIDTVTYTLYSGTSTTGEPLRELAALTETQTLTEGDVNYFKALEKGTYTLLAHQIGSDDYGELNQYMTFSVTQATNTWITTPYITGWTYKQFSANNFQAGETEFGVKDTITYTLYAGDKAEGTALKTFGSITDDGVIDYLRALSKGTYTLLAHQNGTESYGVLNTPLTFTVTPTTNSWATKPRVIGWTYGSFDGSYFIAGVPTFQESKNDDGSPAVVEYTLTKDGDEDFESVTFTESNLYNFALLNAGTYKLNVSYVGTDNYGDLDADEITFNVSQTSNYWQNATPPDISGWTYGAFDESLFTDGAPIHGTATYTVRYVVGGNVGEVVEIDNIPLSGKSYGELKVKLNSLNADTYIIQATSGSTPEYAAAEWSKQFVVVMADNEWDSAPSITGWTYGGTPVTPDNGTAKYENAAISGQYYPTTTDGNGNLIADTSKAPLAAVENAGSYAYVLTVADTTNYNGFTTTLFFTVEKASNEWITSPAGSYSWTWGDDITTLTNNIVNAAVTYGTLSFDIVKTGGGYTVPTDKTINQILDDLAVGEYTITFTVTVNNNYETVATAIAYVTVGAAQLTVTTESACSGWTWGVDDADKVFTDIAVTPAKTDDSVTVQYRVSANGGEGWTNPYNTYDALLGYLKGRSAGDYIVEITAACANHESVTRTVSFTVGKAAFIWSGEQQDAEWEWNGSWTEADGGRNIPNPTCNQAGATLSYTIDGVTYADYAAVKSYLQSNDRNADTYTVRVTATLANYETSEKTFTVTVKVAENEWIGAPDDSYEMVYNQWTELPVTTAKFGTVVYTCGSETITNVNDWIKTCNAQTYVLTLTVAGVNNQYGALSKNVTIVVKSAGSQWANQNNLSADNEIEYNAVYGTDAHAALKDTIVFPIGTAGGTTTYSVYVNGGETADETYTTLAGIQSYFTTALAAGTYVIKAEFVPTSGSFSKLYYTITVVVEKAEVDWDTPLVQGDPQTYKSVVLPDPSADKDFASVTVTVKDGNGNTLDMGGKSLSEFAADLGVGTYTIIATIEDNENYTIVGDQTITIVLYVTALQNAWTDVTTGGKTITAQQWTDGYTWTFTRGDSIAVMLPESVIGTIKIEFDGTLISYATATALNGYLNGRNLAAKEYTLNFQVDADENGNYTGLVSNCIIVINTKSNDWTQQLESVDISGSVDTTTFAMPTATVYQMNGVDLRLFNIVKAGARPNSDWYTEEDFLTELGKLVNGTYTVTARIGGDVRPVTADSSFIQALNLYNADYEEISCSCTVTLSPAENTWMTKLANKSWTWGDMVSVALSVADFGNDQIIYTISGSGVGTITVKTSECDNIQTDLNNAVNGLHPGTYTITASIAATDLYAAPTESNVAIFTVSKYAASWDTEEDLSEYGLLHMTWSQAPDDLLPALNVKYMNSSGNLSTVGATVVWKIGNYQPDEIILELNGLDARTYTVTATYAGDDFNEGLTFTATVVIDKVQAVWDSATTANNGKSYNWVLDSANTVARPVLGTPEWGKTVEYKLVKGSSDLYIGSSWSGLQTALGNCKAGEYTITAHIDGDTNHTELDYSVTVNISAKANSWTDKTGNGNSTAKEIEKTYGDDMSFIKFTPEFGTVVVTVNGITTNDVVGYINSNGIGEYLIVASVDATDEYGELVDTVRLKVTKADNTWNNNLAISNSWTWHDNANNIVTGLTLPVAAQGDSALVVVTVKQTGEVVLEATVSYVRVDGVRKVNDNDFTALNGRLKALGVVSGGYTITVTVSEMDSYKALGGQSADFVINKAINNWATGGDPTVDSWSFGGDTAYPSATPVFGKNTVVFTYAAPSDNDKFEDGKRVAPAADAVWQNAPSYQAGSYWLKAYVAGTDNYSELVGYYLFTIKEGKNAWVNMPGVIAWNWNGYDAAVNLFSGSARSNQPAQFSITKADKSDLDVTDFVAYGNGVIIDVDTIVVLKKFWLVANDVVVSDNVAKLLNALKPATYTLTVTVDGGESLESITGSTTFTVGKAANGWATGKAPAVSSYTYNNYNATSTFTYGETVYGNASAVTYKLEGTTLDNDEVFTSSESKPAYVKLQERLATLGAGSYTLSAWVAASANGTYSALYSEQSPYTTRSFTVARANNGWTNETLVNQINKKYSEIKAAAFTQSEFAKLYAQLTPIDGTVNYALLNADYTSRNTDSLTYAQLFNAIKALPAGEYVIRATVAETTTTNYFGISATDTRLIISSHDNAFTQIPDALTAQWACGVNEDNETVNKTVLDKFEVKATYGADTVTYTLNKTTYESYKDLEDAVSALNAGSYNVTITIAATDDYAGLSEVRMLTVTQGQNSWQNDWVASGSLSVESTTTRAGLSWGWNTSVTWTKAVPVYGKTVYVEIRKAKASSALQYVTLDYGVSNGDSAVAVISEAISKLDVGDYELIVSAPATVNWAALSDKVEFSITKVTNSWDKAPQIGGANGNKWAHGTNAVPDADAKYGDVRYEYTTKSGDKLTSMPTTAGEYVIKFIVDDTINYDGISAVLNVT
ncbi:MAG: hypothetical protein K2M89_00690, partial [Clostridiales bacterium]|nr:hypothetical protein [Clostridiales bacterium]